MKASALEFRLRMAIMAAIVVVGFVAPWGWITGSAREVNLLQWLAHELGRTGLVSFAVATSIAIVAGALLAAIGAALRIWGSAWLGFATVLNSQMKAGSMMADGPYRSMRNPLYLGLWFTIAALSFLMSPTGALFTMVVSGVFLYRLILGEEGFLEARFGQPYLDYVQAVPRLFPRMLSKRPDLQPTGQKPRWLHAVLTELTPVSVLLSFPVFAWSYDSRLMAKVILVGFGVSLVARGIMLGTRREPDSDASLPE